MTKMFFRLFWVSAFTLPVSIVFAIASVHYSAQWCKPSYLSARGIVCEHSAEPAFLWAAAASLLIAIISGYICRNELNN